MSPGVPARRSSDPLELAAELPLTADEGAYVEAARASTPCAATARTGVPSCRDGAGACCLLLAATTLYEYCSDVMPDIPG
jgi:hypothetical protein